MIKWGKKKPTALHILVAFVVGVFVSLTGAFTGLPDLITGGLAG